MWVRGFLLGLSRVRWNSWANSGFEVVEDLADDIGFDNESENFHPCAAAGAGQRVDLVDAVDELSPPFAQSPFGSRVDGFTIRPGQVGVLPSVGCAYAVGVGAVEMAMYRDT